MAATPIQTDGENITVLIIMTPLPGKMGELEKIAIAGAQHHQEVSGCLDWVASKSISLEKLAPGWTDNADEGDLIIVQEWTSLAALIEHGQTEFAKQTREELMPLLASPPTLKVSKSLVGFRR